jgi:hypothetical protein
MGSVVGKKDISAKRVTHKANVTQNNHLYSRIGVLN